jgi:hypothetical protein
VTAMAHEADGRYLHGYEDRWEPYHRPHMDYCDDWGPRRHGWREPWREEWRGPVMFDLAVVKPLMIDVAFRRWAYYRHIYDLGYRFAEAALRTPVLAERFVEGRLRPEEYWRRGEECWPEKRWRREEECWSEKRCEERQHCFGCGRPKRDCCCERRDTTDITIRARQNDVVNKIVLVENNSPRSVTITPEADLWVDPSGALIKSLVTMDPAQLILAPGEAKEFMATITIDVPPLAEGRAYFTRLQLTGSSAPPVSVALSVEPQSRIDYLASVEQGRPQRGSLVEFCEEPKRFHFEYCEPRRGRRGRRYWHRPDPCRTWERPPRCERVWLAPPYGARC